MGLSCPELPQAYAHFPIGRHLASATPATYQNLNGRTPQKAGRHAWLALAAGKEVQPLGKVNSPSHQLHTPVTEGNNRVLFLLSCLTERKYKEMKESLC